VNKHTPGPWKNHGEAVWSEHKSVSGKETRGTRTNHVCAVSSRLKMPDAEREANARLIAAAPDLLVALEAWHKFMLDNYSKEDISFWDQTVNAIAKAKGTQA